MNKRSIPEVLSRAYRDAKMKTAVLEPEYAVSPLDDKIWILGEAGPWAVKHSDLVRFFREQGLKKLFEQKIQEAHRFSHYTWVPGKPTWCAVNGHSALNVYNHPFWETSADEPPQKAPEIIIRHLETLIPKEDARQYLLDWCAASLRGRCATALGLVGEAQGTGKGLFQDVMFRVHGKGNASLSRDEVFKKEFNAQLKNKTLCVFDEFKLKKDQAGLFKSLFGDAVSIEAKGKDSETVDNYASFIFSTNRINDVFIDDGDRRLSIIETTDTPMRDTMTADEMAAYTKELFSEETVAQFGLYLKYSHEIKSNLSKPYQGTLTRDMVGAQMSAWQEAVMHWAKANPGKTLEGDEIVTMIQQKLGPNYSIRPRTVYGACKQHLLLKDLISAKAVARNGFYAITSIASVAKEEEETARGVAEMPAAQQPVQVVAAAAPATTEELVEAMTEEELPELDVMEEPEEWLEVLSDLPVPEVSKEVAEFFIQKVTASLLVGGLRVGPDERHPFDPFGRTVRQVAISLALMEAV